MGRSFDGSDGLFRLTSLDKGILMMKRLKTTTKWRISTLLYPPHPYRPFPLPRWPQMKIHTGGWRNMIILRESEHRSISISMLVRQPLLDFGSSRVEIGCEDASDGDSTWPIG